MNLLPAQCRYSLGLEGESNDSPDSSMVPLRLCTTLRIIGCGKAGSYPLLVKEVTQFCTHEGSSPV